MSWIDAWLFPVGSVLLGGVGLLVLVRGLFGGRFRVGTARACRRCRYDMTETEGHRCPECGYVHRHEGEHYAGRRRWLVAGLGVVLLVGAVGLSRWDEIRNRGWWVVMPTGLQLAWLPHSGNVRLWEHMGIAVRTNGLTESQEQELRDAVMGRMLDPNADPTDAMGTVRLTWSQRLRSSPVASRDDLARIAVEGSPAARAFAVEMLGYPIPTTEEEIEVRRRAWAEATPANQRQVLTWIAKHAIGEGDLAILRQAMQNDPWSASLLYQDLAAESTGGLGSLLADLLDDPDPDIRLAAARSFERWMGEREGKPPIEVQRRLIKMMADDPDIRIPDTIDRYLEDMSPEVGPHIGDALLRVFEQRRFRSFMYGIRRKDDASIIPALLAAAKQPERSIRQRLDASEGALYVWRRTRRETNDLRPDPADPEMLTLYGGVVDALRGGDVPVILSVGREGGLGWTVWLVRAIGDRAAIDDVARDELNDWLSVGGLGEVLLMSVPGVDSPRGALLQILSQGMRADEGDADGALLKMAERWFPELIETEEPPGDAAGSVPDS